MFYVPFGKIGMSQELCVDKNLISQDVTYGLKVKKGLALVLNSSNTSYIEWNKVVSQLISVSTFSNAPVGNLSDPVSF